MWLSRDESGYLRWKKGKLPGSAHQTPNGRAKMEGSQAVLYARVSSEDQNSMKSGWRLRR